MSTAPPRRRRLAISVRGLLLLVLLVGVFLGWRVHRAREQQRAARVVRDNGGTLHYDWEFAGGTFTPGGKPPGPAWLRRLLGDEYFQEVAWVSIADTDPMDPENASGRRIDRVLVALRAMDRLRELHLNGRQLRDAHLARIRDLTSLERLEIWGAVHLTDAGLAHLRGLGHLRSIAINDCALTDASLDPLADIPSLEELDLRGNRLTDAGLGRLSRLSRLRRLRLGYGRNAITDRGMESLRGIRSLEVLDLEQTRVGDAGLKSLEGLPDLKEVSTGKSRVTPRGIGQFQSGSPGVRVIP
jgi:hypothetical protein